VTGLVGAIWTIRPGLDADLGRQATIHASQTVRTWLIGLTWRFAL
jgi:hypothetical protein